MQPAILCFEFVSVLGSVAVAVAVIVATVANIIAISTFSVVVVAVHSKARLL